MKGMKWLDTIIAVAIVALVMVARGAIPASAYPLALGLAGTPHDFTNGSSTFGNSSAGLCTYCHTPHHAPVQELLWNHNLSANNFTWAANSVTAAGTVYPSFDGDTYKGPSAKCLSCHDGSVAIGDVAWFNEAGPVMMNAGTLAGDAAHQIATISGGMTGNHPVAMPYPALSTPSTYNGKVTGAGIILGEWVSNPTPGIRLFNDDGAGNISAGVVSAKTGIECSSCHDPHNGVTAIGDFFLRGEPFGAVNYICTKCHIK